MHVTFFGSSISIAFLSRNKLARCKDLNGKCYVYRGHVVERLGCGRSLLVGSCMFEGGEKEKYVLGRVMLWGAL